MFQLIFEEYKDILKSTSRRLRFWEWAMIVVLALSMITAIVASLFGNKWLPLLSAAIAVIDTVIIVWYSYRSKKKQDTWKKNTMIRAEKLKDSLRNNGMDVQKGCDYIIESCDRELNSKKKKFLPILNSTVISIILPVFVVFLNKTTDETTIKSWLLVALIVAIAYPFLYYALLQLDLTTIKTDWTRMLRDDAAYLKAKNPN